MNRAGFTTAPEWAQAAMVVGEMLRAFAGRGTATLVSLTEQQGEAVEFADAFMDGCSSRFADLLLGRLLAPLDALPYCESPDCKAGPGCHVHKPAVAAAIIKRWVEYDTPRASAIQGAEVLDGAWKTLCDLARTTDHDGAKQCLDDLARAAFDKAREIVKTAEGEEGEPC